MLLGSTEIIVILAVALLVFGPKKLPEIARTLGKAVGTLRQTMDEVKREVSITGFEEHHRPTRMDKNSETTSIEPEDSTSETETKAAPENESKSRDE